MTTEKTLEQAIEYIHDLKIALELARPYFTYPEGGANNIIGLTHKECLEQIKDIENRVDTFLGL